jgi:hypothetical protein
MSEYREKLKPYHNKRVVIRGTITAYGSWMQNHRKVGRFCLTEPELNGEIICGHVWVTGTNHLEPCEIGRRVEVDVTVNQYSDASIGRSNYGLKNPGKLIILDKPAALAIPCAVALTTTHLPEEETTMLANGEAFGEAFERPDVKNVLNVIGQASIAAPHGDGLEMVKTVRAFMKTVGGPKKARKFLEALPAGIPLGTLTEWVMRLTD